MAGRIETKIVPLGQALHGYRDGHELLASSIDLDEASAATMLVMSDLAPRGSPPEEGWITAYPLPRADRYVIARTWPAPEMRRPGCVWTHSLIIDYSTLGSAPSLAPFLALLRKPRREMLPYTLPLDPPPRRPSASLPPRLYSVARQALTELYSSAGEVRCRVADPHDAELLGIVLWDQQWPRLRRRFRWASLDLQLSAEIPKFDLLLVKTDDAPAQRLLVPTTNDTKRQGWIVAALFDLRAGGGDLRSELRRLAIDVQTGRRAFSLLVSTLLLIKSPKARVADAHALITLLTRRLKPEEAKYARASILAALLRWSETLEGESLAFALALLPYFDGGSDAVVIGRAAWQTDRTAFWQVLPTTKAGRYAQAQVLEELDTGELVYGIDDPAVDIDAILAVRPDLLTVRELWRGSDDAGGALINYVRAHPEHVPAAVAGAFAAKNISLADAILGAGSRAPMFAVYMDWERAQGRRDEQRQGFYRSWLASAALDEHSTADYLAGEFRLRPGVAALARICGPRSFPPDPSQRDLWETSWEECAGRPVREDREFISAFFLYRACYLRSRNQAKLFTFAFDTLIECFERGLIDPHARALVADHFSQYGMFSLMERDVTRVFRGVARLVGTKKVPISHFIAQGRTRFVEDLVNQLQWQAGGKEALGLALSELSETPLTRKRMRLLENALT